MSAEGRGRKVFLTICMALGACGLLAGDFTPQEARAQPAAAAHASGSLTAFRSDAELRRFLRRHRAAQTPPPMPVMAPMPAPPSPEPGAVAPAEAMNETAADMDISVTGSAARQESITNTQEANVDEGGIVKVSGDNLVILRRGRLFTVNISRGDMRPVDSINAFPPGVSGEGDWYDEMLLLGDRVIVVGYSYDRGGTELNRFRLSPNVTISLGARVKLPGEAMVGEAVELLGEPDLHHVRPGVAQGARVLPESPLQGENADPWPPIHRDQV